MCDSASAAAEPTIIDLASLAGGLKLKNIKVKAMARTAAENRSPSHRYVPTSSFSSLKSSKTAQKT